MIRSVLIVSACVVTNACAVIEMPRPDENSDWVSQRLTNETHERTAPETIPQTRMSEALSSELDQNADAVLERRSELIEEELEIASDDKLTTNDFVEAGVARNTPPD